MKLCCLNQFLKIWFTYWLNWSLSIDKKKSVADATVIWCSVPNYCVNENLVTIWISKWNHGIQLDILMIRSTVKIFPKSARCPSRRTARRYRCPPQASSFPRPPCASVQLLRFARLLPWLSGVLSFLPLGRALFRGERHLQFTKWKIKYGIEQNTVFDT